MTGLGGKKQWYRIKHSMLCEVCENVCVDVVLVVTVINGLGEEVTCDKTKTSAITVANWAMGTMRVCNAPRKRTRIVKKLT
jgi:hypothetical protein